MRFDLHIHTTASDGAWTPAQVVAGAHEGRLDVIAITDHDSLEGVKSALRQPIPPALKFLTGLEISAAPPPFIRLAGSFHILGYGIDPQDSAQQQRWSKLRNSCVSTDPRCGPDPCRKDRFTSGGTTLSLSPHKCTGLRSVRQWVSLAGLEPGASGV